MLKLVNVSIIRCLIVVVFLGSFSTRNVAAATTQDASCPAGSVIPASITADTTLGGELVMPDTVLIANATLTLLPGTHIRACAGKSIILGDLFTGRGGLIAQGTAAQPISIVAATPGQKWGRIRFSTGDNNPIRASALRYVTLSDGGAVADTGTVDITMQAESEALSIDHITIASSGGYGMLVNTYSSPSSLLNLSNLTITGSAKAPINLDAANLHALAGGNTFNNNTPNTVQVRSSEVRGSQTWARQPVPLELLGTVFFLGTTDNTRGEINPLLTIAPGTTLLLHRGVSLTIGGGAFRARLHAAGTAAAPIALQSVDGPWGSLNLGENPTGSSRLAYVSFEGGGGDSTSDYAAMLALGATTVQADHLQLRASSNAGLSADGTALLLEDSTIEVNRIGLRLDGGTMQLRRNTIRTNGIGLINPSANSTCVDAIGNFWGDAQGPVDTSAAPDRCAPAGMRNGGGGNSVSDGVKYTPWLNSGDGSATDPSSLSPDPFWVSANNIETATLTITARDTKGNPLVGKQIVLATTLGTLTQPTQPTDARGQVTASIRSDRIGLATISARNVTDNTSLSAITVIRFWRGEGNTGGLIALRGAPYETPQLVVGGKPFEIGRPITFQLPLKNGNPTPVQVRVIYAVSGLNIGANWTPVFTASKTLQAGESWGAPGGWLPDQTGHHCVQVRVEITPLTAGAAILRNADILTFVRQQNLDIGASGKTGTPRGFGEGLGLSDPYNLNCWGLIPSPSLSGSLRDIAETYWNAANVVREAARFLDQSLTTDPPVHTYGEIAPVTTYPSPHIAAGPGISQAIADGLNGMSDAAAQLRGLNDAISATEDRIGGAAEAGDWSAASRQSAALRDFTQRSAEQLRAFATSSDGVRSAINDVSLSDFTPSVSDAREYLNDLRSHGFSPGVIAYFTARRLGQSEIDAIKDRLIDRLGQSGFTPISFYQSLTQCSDGARASANAINIQVHSSSRLAVPTSATAASEPVTLPGSAISVPFLVGNPTGATATVSLQVHPIDLPINWTYQIDTPAPTLAAGQNTTATFTLYSNGPVVEDTQVRIAIEGEINGEVIGGIVVVRRVPRFVADTHLRVYLPLTLH